MWLIAIFFMVSIGIKGTYLSAVLFKFFEGGYPPLCFAVVLMVVMGIWHHVHKQRYMFELKNKVFSEHMKQLASDPNINRVPGVGLLYSELVQGIPPIVSQYVFVWRNFRWGSFLANEHAAPQEVGAS
ncbi:hypothetical protein ACFX2B_011835 [Malus domestica]